MTEEHRALYAFWSGFTDGETPIPAYVSGHVPPGAAFPYIVFTVSDGRALSSTTLTATVWSKGASGVNVNGQCAAILDQIDKAIPEADKPLPIPGGMMLLRRGSGDFHSWTIDPEDSAIVGGVTRYEVTFYHD